MDLIEAADAIRGRLIEHRICRKASFWSTILKQIRKQDSFDGQFADTILEIIRSFLSQLETLPKTQSGSLPSPHWSQLLASGSVDDGSAQDRDFNDQHSNRSIPPLQR